MTTCAFCGTDIVDDRGVWIHVDGRQTNHWPSPQSVYEEAFAAGRLAGLEEAARVAEAYEPQCESCPRGIDTAIRALEAKKP